MLCMTQPMCELDSLVVDERQTSTHSGCEVATGQTQDDRSTASHVLTTVIATTLQQQHRDDVTRDHINLAGKR